MNEARAKIETMKGKGLVHELAGFYSLYEERIAEYKTDPPSADWDGVFVATSK
jgi:adenylate cyclase